ncbi:NAD(P)/FAD-dependent oxidoreductase [Cellulomonas sp. zg-ZUI222]|uniref:NAD(P)/FAD-dependent oxidoreductase n=1 Tax=Cellulomonas wangleii TaxID=2816956 RepID=A0ABX8DBL0_9CELL|nr:MULTISPECIES: NAD(P)/FAD-dependent oxidoreductase [Cellulomonas]MBO0900872.1 NAD(P)/FAD-dependent oxidoreductase [Cellulomonas sp. zg-ZUI22]MBO0921527.1 NAD(P)/FAD-dependent oxidoreductase [Cellulomonas wangleii]MBO0925023.1 NAD(P)/FAD-dependent oxidoreductase [Cellulomonas wangleii]QVI63557.1 NAD(P)/FAD-dependent oxidoreductase [Cellulomonas wangleii]
MADERSGSPERDGTGEAGRAADPGPQGGGTVDRSTRADDEFDVVVLGAGAVGENVADRASRTGLRVAVVEPALVGGECSYWACMPSKALLRPGDALAAARAVPGADAALTGDLDVAAVLARRDEVAAHWDDAGQVAWVEGAGLTLVRGHARFTGPRTLTVERADGTARPLRARHAVVVATGSVAVVPDAFAGVRAWTSREATSAHRVPPRLAVVGGGVVATEMATAFADLGSEVTVLVRGRRLLPAAEPFAGDAVARSLTDRGVRVAFGASVTSASRDEEGVHLTVERAGDDGAPGAADVVTVDEVLVATGRRPATDDLGLEVLGLRPGDPLAVDDRLQVTSVEGGWLFAAGDVTGRTATTHQGKYDARVVGDVVAARFDPRDPGAVSDDPAGLSRAAEAAAAPWSRYRATADAAAVPQVVFTRPQVAWVGRTEAAARAEGLDVEVLSYELGDLAGATVTAADYAGRAQLVVDRARDVVVGATFVGPDVADMLHAATVAVVGQVPLARLWHAVPSYPTLSEVWLRLLEAAGR